MVTLDLSNHDEASLNAQCLKDSGVTRVIMGCQLSGRPADRMIPQLRAVGIEVRDVYAFLGLGGYYLEPTNNAIAVAQTFSIPRVWLDVEGDDVVTGATYNSVNPDMRIKALWQCIELVEDAGLEVGIYTGRWFWVPHMRNTTEFNSYPLWHSEYPLDNHEVREVNYGGWTTVSIHQYSSSINLCGRVRDHNYVFETEEEPMTPEEKKKLDAVYNALCAGDDRVIDDWNANGNSMLKGYTNLYNAVAKSGITIEDK